MNKGTEFRKIADEHRRAAREAIMPRVRVMQLEAAARMERLANKLSAGSFFPAQSLVRIKVRKGSALCV